MSSWQDSLIQMAVYSSFFVIAILFAVLINGLLLKFLKNIGQRNEKNGTDQLIRWAAQTRPAIGGISFFILFLLSISAYFILPFGSAQFYNKALLALVGSTTLGFLIGLIDDSYNTPPSFKFFGQLACAILMIVMEVYIPISGIYLIDIVFTIFWVVGIMNSINMLDNMDGITASVSTSVCLIALMVAAFSNLTGFYPIILLGVLASLVGFLFFNWHPAKMYMGDSGSQFLGAFLSVISIVLLWQFRHEEAGMISMQQFMLPALAFLLPIIDTTTVFVRRIKRGQSPFLGGRDHTTHHLAYCGLSDAQVGLVFVGFSLLSILLSYWVMSDLKADTWTLAKSLVIVFYCLLMLFATQFFYEKGKKKHQK